MSDRDRDHLPGSRDLVLHSETARRREHIASLRNQLGTLFAERVRLNFDLLPALRERYHELFSDLEVALQLRTLEFAERRRIVELISLKLDRGQKLDEKSIELVLKAVRTEFARVRARLHKSPDDTSRGSIDVEWGVEQTRHTPAQSRAEELRDLYRRLARQLHPDVQRSVQPAREKNEAQRRHYWDLVQTGYFRNDIGLLRTLAHLVETLGVTTEIPLALFDVEEQRLEMAIKSEQTHIDSIMEIDIVRMRAEFDIPDRVNELRDQLKIEISQLEANILNCDTFLKSVLGGRKIPPPEVLKTLWADFVEHVYINNY